MLAKVQATTVATRTEPWTRMPTFRFVKRPSRIVCLRQQRGLAYEKKLSHSKMMRPPLSPVATGMEIIVWPRPSRFCKRAFEEGQV
jgi:hypothetical protein